MCFNVLLVFLMILLLSLLLFLINRCYMWFRKWCVLFNFDLDQVIEVLSGFINILYNFSVLVL